MKSESQVLREIGDWLYSQRYFFWRCNNIPVMGRALPKYTPKGLPDLMVITYGKFIAFEVKRPTEQGAREKNGRALRQGMLSPVQAEWGIALENNGGFYFCVRSLEEVKSYMNIVQASINIGKIV